MVVKNAQGRSLKAHLPTQVGRVCTWLGQARLDKCLCRKEFEVRTRSQSRRTNHHRWRALLRSDAQWRTAGTQSAGLRWRSYHLHTLCRPQKFRSRRCNGLVGSLCKHLGPGDSLRLKIQTDRTRGKWELIFKKTCNSTGKRTITRPRATQVEQWRTRKRRQQQATSRSYRKYRGSSRPVHPDTCQRDMDMVWRCPHRRRNTCQPHKRGTGPRTTLFQTRERNRR